MEAPRRSNPVALTSFLWVLLITGAACFNAKAQVYSGVSETGAIVLSSHMDGTAQTLLIEAERVPSVAVVVPPAEHADFLQSVPPSYLPFIREASSAYRIPGELIHAVISVESNYNPNAISPKGARGLMQLMPETAKRFGSNNSSDPRQNILTGSRYLRWLLDYFGEDVELAIAAYNAGEAAVVQAGHKIPRFSETQRYVPKVLSIYQKAKPLT
jgi:soluble lytic murein transglycosylase-like protein